MQCKLQSCTLIKDSLQVSVYIHVHVNIINNLTIRECSWSKSKKSPCMMSENRYILRRHNNTSNRCDRRNNIKHDLSDTVLNVYDRYV